MQYEMSRQRLSNALGTVELAIVGRQAFAASLACGRITSFRATQVFLQPR